MHGIVDALGEHPRHIGDVNRLDVPETGNVPGILDYGRPATGRWLDQIACGSIFANGIRCRQGFGVRARMNVSR